ncbi:putative holin [Erwinia amylovora]|uniref:Phage holin family protein n=4 Tax=Erwinia amylovora TaxID=552 RepID=A0ABX7MKZ2_ERWAM|nr:putative holin [Erwinia amylovora]CBX80405.1 putative prophage membrane protein [Erwinia amylovora ATCC BAA-2158]CDK15045.1 putative prophage membrane protein [Erwinia amylovora LA635]CDK18413.1 putative prophage membrane protein [Erwinia amylovora LA636]CDK21782.1 putative prophage membrane protein [Erwinia amylovora LA637]ATZ11365.1 holin [Erwinia amylovora]
MSTSILTSSQGSLMTAVVSAVGDTGSADYCIFFGAFAGAVFYVATAAYMKVIRRAAYFLVSWIVGVYGAGLVGTKLEQILGYSDQSLDGLGAVILSALAIKTLTFFSQQDPATWFTRLKGGPHGNK